MPRSHLFIVFVAAAATAAFTTVTSPAASGAAVSHRIQPKSYCTPSGQSGGAVDQAAVLSRAQVWVDENVPYTQNCGHHPGGYYREDCSGFVSMAWELTESLVTWDFNPAANGGDPRFQQIAQSNLIPGDALVVDNSSSDHIALFTRWSSSDNGQHRYADLSEESDFGVGTIAVTNQDLDGGYWGQFTPIHYTKMTLPVSSGSSVFVPSNGSYHVFWTGAGGHLMQTYYLSDGWHTQDLGGVIAGAPGVTYHDGRYDVFAVSPGGHLFQRTYSGSWGAWRNLGGSWSAGVSAVYVAASNNYHVFGHYPSGHLQQYYWSGSWHRQDLGGVTAGTPGVSYHNGRYDVFAVSPGGHLFQRTYSGGWGAWHQIGSAAYHPGVGAVYTGTSYHVFLRSSDDHMAQVYYNSTGWHGPQHLGGTFGNGPGVTYHGGRYDLFGPAGGGIYQSTYTGHWSAWHKVSA